MELKSPGLVASLPSHCHCSPFPQLWFWEWVLHRPFRLSCLASESYLLVHFPFPPSPAHGGITNAHHCPWLLCGLGYWVQANVLLAEPSVQPETLKKKFINFCFVGVCLHLISVHHVRAWHMQRSEEGLRSSGTGVVHCHVESRTLGAKSDVIAMINFELSPEVIMLNLTMNTMSTFRYWRTFDEW